MFRLALVFVALTLLQGVISSPISETPAIAGVPLLGGLLDNIVKGATGSLSGAIGGQSDSLFRGSLGNTVKGATGSVSDAIGGVSDSPKGVLGQRDEEAGSALSEVLPIAGIVAGNGCVAVPGVTACAGGLAAGAIGLTDEPAGDDDGASGEGVGRRFFFPLYIPPAPAPVNGIISEVGAIGANGVNGISIG